MEQNNSVAKGLAWKLMERFGVQGTQFVLQVVLARILSPEHYGVLSLMLIFTALANVFIQQGFNTALIQNKDVTEEDYSSVFWVTLMISGLLYAVLFFTAPLIAAFYEMPELVAPLRVLALVFFPGTMNSVQLAKVSRELDFKKIFTIAYVSSSQYFSKLSRVIAASSVVISLILGKMLIASPPLWICSRL